MSEMRRRSERDHPNAFNRPVVSILKAAVDRKRKCGKIICAIQSALIVEEFVLHGVTAPARCISHGMVPIPENRMPRLAVDHDLIDMHDGVYGAIPCPLNAQTHSCGLLDGVVRIGAIGHHQFVEPMICQVEFGIPLQASAQFQASFAPLKRSNRAYDFAFMLVAILIHLEDAAKYHVYCFKKYRGRPMFAAPYTFG